MADPFSSSLNPPKQPRSRRTLERLVGAALELLESEGPEGVTVQAVVARARSSVGSFYARFGGKDDLLDYLQERVWEDALSRWDEAVQQEAWSAMDLAQIAEGAAGLLIDVRRGRSGRLRQLDRMSGRGDAYDRFRRHLVSSLETLLLERREEIAHPKPELAVRLGLTAVAGVIEAGLDTAVEGGPGEPLGRDDLVNECADLLLRYLVGGDATRGGEPVEFFDVWG